MLTGWTKKSKKERKKLVKEWLNHYGDGVTFLPMVGEGSDDVYYDGESLVEAMVENLDKKWTSKPRKQRTKLVMVWLNKFVMGITLLPMVGESLDNVYYKEEQLVKAMVENLDKIGKGV